MSFEPEQHPIQACIVDSAPMSFVSFACLRDNQFMSAKKTPVYSSDAPAAIGPYVQAIRVGDTVYTSGQIPLDPASGNMVEGDITEQTRRVLESLKAVLTGAGLTLEDVVKTTVFMQDLSDFAAMNAIYESYFAAGGATPPARSTVQVAALPRKALVEVECIARG